MGSVDSTSVRGTPLLPLCRERTYSRSLHPQRDEQPKRKTPHAFCARFPRAPSCAPQSQSTPGGVRAPEVEGRSLKKKAGRSGTDCTSPSSSRRRKKSRPPFIGGGRGWKMKRSISKSPPAPPTTPIRDNLTADVERRAAAELARRHYCVWIANPYAPRCPRWQRTNEKCHCQVLSWRERDWDWWPWRVLPPLRATTASDGSEATAGGGNG